MGWKKLLGEKLDTILADGKNYWFGCLKKICTAHFLPLAILLTTAKNIVQAIWGGKNYWEKNWTRVLQMEKLLIWMLKKIAQPISATNDTIDNS